MGQRQCARAVQARAGGHVQAGGRSWIIARRRAVAAKALSADGDRTGGGQGAANASQNQAAAGDLYCSCGNDLRDHQAAGGINCAGAGDIARSDRQDAGRE